MPYYQGAGMIYQNRAWIRSFGIKRHAWRYQNKRLIISHFQRNSSIIILAVAPNPPGTELRSGRSCPNRVGQSSALDYHATRATCRQAGQLDIHNRKIWTAARPTRVEPSFED
jgi:hypothetical protein